MAHWIIFGIVAYLLSAIPFGRIVSKGVARLDITTVGSGNIGATNVARELGLKWGLLTLLLDVLKGFLPVLAAVHFAAGSETRGCTGPAVVALSAVLGHQFSVFRGFCGGKGVATALGVYLALSPLAALSAVGVFLVSVYRWDRISLGSLTSAAALPLILLLFMEPLPVVLLGGVTAGLIGFRHAGNIRRLFRGEEPRWRERGATRGAPAADPTPPRSKNR